MAFKEALEYVKGANKEKTPKNFVVKNGIFKVELTDLFGRETKSGASMIDFEFTIVGTDEVITVSELYEYKDKKTGEMVEAKGAFLVRAMLGMASGKSKAKAKWIKTVKKVFGEELSGYTIKNLKGNIFYIVTYVERSIYNTKAVENNKIKRLMSANGLSLAEYEEALTAVENGKIESIEDFEDGTALEKEKSKPLSYRYKDCTEDEWYEVSVDKSTDVSDTSNKADDNLPVIEDSDDLPIIEDIENIEDIDTEIIEL